MTRGDRRQGAAAPDRSRLLPRAAIAALAGAIVATSFAVAGARAGALGAALGLLTLAIAVIDATRFLIPNALSLAVFALGLAAAASGAADPALAVALALTRACALALLFLGLRALYTRWRGREGLGLGDVKLAGAAGAWLDWPYMPIAIDIAALSALAAYGVLQLARRRALRAEARLPFGLFLAPSIWICWLIAAVVSGA